MKKLCPYYRYRDRPLPDALATILSQPLLLTVLLAMILVGVLVAVTWRPGSAEAAPGPEGQQSEAFTEVSVADLQAITLPARWPSLAEMGARLPELAAADARLGLALATARQAADLVGQAATARQQGQPEQAEQLLQQARQLARTAYYQSYPPVEGELRGMWMHYYAKPSWAAAMQTLREHHFNAAFPYMMSGGVAYYKSKLLPHHPSVAQQGDYLAAAVQASRQSGVLLHVRMLNLSTLFATAETRQRLAAQGRLMVSSTGQRGDWLCPTQAINRREQVAAALELAAAGVDGIQFDYLRYPGKNYCFCQACRQAFEKSRGTRVVQWPKDVTDGSLKGAFADWRREQVTSLVAEITEAVRREYPGVMVSAAVFLNWESHRENFGQDWKAWVEQGLVDFVCPMNYTTNSDTFRLYVSRQQKWIADRLPYASGIGVHADNHRCPGPHMVLEQIRIAREHGSQGFVIFNYSDTVAREYLPALKAGVTREPTGFRCGLQRSGLQRVDSK
jgi:uncharacterized lipoprotein YddW (UPF0748 family)